MQTVFNLGKWVGLFCRININIQKNTTATGIAQKSYKALFPLCSLKKKDIIEINKI